MTGDEVVFSWQGGEPTLLGLDFFRKVVALQRKHAKPGQRIENDLQTNGTLLDEDWARFLKEHRFLVGPDASTARATSTTATASPSAAQPTFDKVYARGEAAAALRRAVQHADLRATASTPRGRSMSTASCAASWAPPTCSSSRSSRSRASRRRRRRPGIRRSCRSSARPQAQPDHPDSVVTPWSVDPDEYGYFLSKVWDEWLARDVGKVLVNLFETLVAQHMGLPSQLCIYGEFCGKGVAIEHDGSVYCCDHYVYPEYRLGNIRAAARSATWCSRRRR